MVGTHQSTLFGNDETQRRGTVPTTFPAAASVSYARRASPTYGPGTSARLTGRASARVALGQGCPSQCYERRLP